MIMALLKDQENIEKYKRNFSNLNLFNLFNFIDFNIYLCDS